MIRKLNIKKFEILEELELLEIEELKELRILRKRPRFWVNPFLEQREKCSMEEHLLKDLLWEDSNEFRNFCRMTIDSFENILSLVETSISQEDTHFRYAISARARLAITLRFIATGDSYRSLEYLTRVSRKTISKFVPQVLSEIYKALQPTYLKMPTTESEWLKVAEDFNNIWNFPHTLGALDGKHIRIKMPPHSHSDFYNYKGYFSVVLLALVDAHCKFIYIDVGANGRVSDNIILKNCELYQSLLRDSLNIPPAEQLGTQSMKVPYFFIGDDIFGLEKNIMKPFNRNISLTTLQEIFNYRLSRARISAEMTFGRFASRFRIFHRPMETSLDCVDKIIQTCCVLHNYLSKDITIPEMEQTSTEPLPSTITPISQQEGNKYKHACAIRNTLASYCISDGDVPFQWEAIKKNKFE